MRRADRLFQIVTFLQGRRSAVTARRIAEEFDVCERTVYRDLQDLQLSGVPVSGEAGVGYILDASYNLPPLMFTPDEIETLLLGISMVESWTDETTAAAARGALLKIRAALGGKERGVLASAALFAPQSAAKVPWTCDFSTIRKAIRLRQALVLYYADDKGQRTVRKVRPLALAFFAPVWVLLAWCELRQDFRNFRLDRITDAEDQGERFRDESGKRLVDFLAREGIEDRRPA